MFGKISTCVGALRMYPLDLFEVCPRSRATWLVPSNTTICCCILLSAEDDLMHISLYSVRLCKHSSLCSVKNVVALKLQCYIHARRKLCKPCQRHWHRLLLTRLKSNTSSVGHASLNGTGIEVPHNETHTPVQVGCQDRKDASLYGCARQIRRWSPSFRWPWHLRACSGRQ